MRKQSSTNENFREEIITTTSYNFYVYTLLSASIISVIVDFMAFKKRKAVGAAPLIVMMTAIFVWTLFQAMSFVELNFQLKLIFANMRYFGIEAAPLSFYGLASGYENVHNGQSLKKWLIILVFPIIMLISLWTNPIHNMFYLKVYMSNNILVLENGPLFWINMIYLYAFVLLAIYIFIRRSIKSTSIYRGQAITIALAASIPILSNLAFNFDILPFKDIDITPFSFLITGILQFYALFHFKLLDIVPFARDRLVEEMEDIVIVIDERNRVLDLNKKARDTIYKDNDYVGKDISLVLGTWAELYEYISRRENTSSKINYSRNGINEYYDIRISKFHLKNGKKNGELIVLRNITELEEALQEAKILKELADQANMAKGHFLANMSHEIRTPMNAVIGVAEILENTELSKSEQKRYIRMIVNSAESLLTVINDILDFSKIEAGKLEIENKSFNIKELVNDTVETFSVIAQKKNLKLDCIIQEDIIPDLLGDALRVRQILINLLGNSIKFTDEGNVKVTLKLVEKKSDKITAALIVSDTGIGIAEEKIERIFESFKQADSSPVRKFGGTGLGLSIVKKLVELMGGSIEVNSELGKGSVFTCYIPFEIDKLVQKEDKAIKNEKYEKPLELKILVAEDNKINRQIAAAYIKKLGCFADFAENGVIAVQKYLQNVYDVVLMDVQMPEMDGLTAAKEIRSKENGKHTPIIALTAGAMKEDIEQCMEAGMDAHISKPVRIDKLYEILSSIGDK